MADAGREMAARGFRVIVYTADRGYEDTSVRFPKKETLDGMSVRRLPFCSFGKGSIRARLLGGISFVAQAFLRGLFVRKHAILVSTSPPFSALAALALGWLRRVGILFWVMDLNPDQALALKVARPGSFSVRLFEALNRRILSRADCIVALDRFMAGRLENKGAVSGRLEVLPPWPHNDPFAPLAHAENHFREERGWRDRFVFMFSGNLSIASPADTILEASLRLRDDPRALFVFIGGGLGRRDLEKFMERNGPGNIESYPYQPLDRIRFSLSAADVHLVTMGAEMAGMIHPSKVYGAMSVGRPILFLGPAPSHISDILDEYDIGWRIEHGDVDGAERILREILATDPAMLRAKGERARRAVEERFVKKRLAGRFCDCIEDLTRDAGR